MISLCLHREKASHCFCHALIEEFEKTSPAKKKHKTDEPAAAPAKPAGRQAPKEKEKEPEPAVKEKEKRGKKKHEEEESAADEGQQDDHANGEDMNALVGDNWDDVILEVCTVFRFKDILMMKLK